MPHSYSLHFWLLSSLIFVNKMKMVNTEQSAFTKGLILKIGGKKDRMRLFSKSTVFIYRVLTTSVAGEVG